MKYTRAAPILLFISTTLAAPQSLPQPADNILTVPTTVIAIPIPTSVGNNLIERGSGHSSHGHHNNGAGNANDSDNTSTGGAAALTGPTGPVTVGLVGAAGLLAIALGV